MKSVLHHRKECWVCGSTYNIHVHHVFYGTANRKNSDSLGLTVNLCYDHHNGSKEGVHFDKNLDSHLKKFAQEYYEKNIGSRDDFRKVFGKSYL